MTAYHQRGFAIVAAVFLLVILSAMGAFMMNISTSHQIGAVLDVQGSQAYRAARAGIDWAAATLCNGGNPCATPLTACPATPAEMTVDGYAVTVTCTAYGYDEAGSTRNIFFLESTATIGSGVGAINYVERTLNSIIEF